MTVAILMSNLSILSTPEAKEIIEGAENIFDKALAAAATIKQQLDGCFDHTDSVGLVTIEDRWKSINDIAKRGVQMRYLTDIREDNIQYCKEMMRIGIDLRHLEGVKGNFGIADRRDCINILLQSEGERPTQALVSNVRSFVEQQQYFFDTLWQKGRFNPIINRDSITKQY